MNSENIRIVETVLIFSVYICQHFLCSQLNDMKLRRYFRLKLFNCFHQIFGFRSNAAQNGKVSSSSSFHSSKNLLKAFLFLLNHPTANHRAVKTRTSLLVIILNRAFFIIPQESRGDFSSVEGGRNQQQQGFNRKFFYFLNFLPLTI